MPRSENEPLVRMHLWMFQRDQERLHQYFGETIGVSKAVRRIVNEALNRLEARVNSRASHGKLNPTDIPE